jgi:tetraacyldisaccharide-1-P 4'-kinase
VGGQLKTPIVASIVYDLTWVSCSVDVSQRASGMQQTGIVSSRVGREWVKNGFM